MYVVMDRSVAPYVHEALWNPPRRERVWRGVVPNGCIYVVHFIPAFKISRSVSGELRVYTPKLLSTTTSELAQFVYHVMSARATYRPGTDVVVMSMSCYDDYLTKLVSNGGDNFRGDNLDFRYVLRNVVVTEQTAVALLDGEFVRFQLDVATHELMGRVRELLLESRDHVAFYYATRPPHKGSALVHGVAIYLIPTDAVSRVVRVMSGYTAERRIPWTPIELAPGIALLIISAVIAEMTQSTIAFIPFIAGLAFILDPWVGWLWRLLNMLKTARFKRGVGGNVGQQQQQ